MEPPINWNSEIQEDKEVWVAWTNSDLTEGRGQRKVLAVCASEATAIRLGKGKYVMGSNCPVSPIRAVKHKNTWLVPGNIVMPSQEDVLKQAAADRKSQAIEKAKAAGLSDEDIKALIV